jgi:hypothetical protein
MASDEDLESYKTFFDFWTKTRAERTQYNQYFITLLFVNTLVAVFTAVIGLFSTALTATATNATVVSNATLLAQNIATTSAFSLAKWLLVAILITGAVISLIWLIKLWTLQLTTDSQEEVLQNMENGFLAPTFKGVSNFKSELNRCRGHGNGARRLLKQVWRTNYYILPLLFFAFYVFLSVYVSFWFQIGPH